MCVRTRICAHVWRRGGAARDGKGRGEGQQSPSVEEIEIIRRGYDNQNLKGREPEKTSQEQTLNIRKRLHLYLSTVFIMHKETNRSQVKNHWKATGRTQKGAASVVGKISLLQFCLTKLKKNNP